MSDKQFSLPFGITVTVYADGRGTISSSLMDGCPGCGRLNCYRDCPDPRESEAASRVRRDYNRACDGLESLILAAACAGVAIDSPEFAEAVRTAENAIGHEFGEEDEAAVARRFRCPECCGGILPCEACIGALAKYLADPKRACNPSEEASDGRK